MPQQQEPQWKSFRGIGNGGLQTLKDPQDLADNESPYMTNMVYDDGIIGPRLGSLLFLGKPSGETADPFQLMKASDSGGTDYLLGVFGTNFYLADPGALGTANKQQWILLNDAYSPTSVKKIYGYDTWHAGKGSDYFYFCNGIDSVMEWTVSLGYLKVAAASANTTVTLTDSSGFPASGKIIIVKNDATLLLLSYNANNVSTGVLTLTSGTVGANINIGNAVTLTMLQKGSMPIGKIIRVASPQSYARLFIANKSQSENLLNYSQAGNPESFSVTADLVSGGTRQITKGEGGILDIQDFGEFLVIVKHNALISYSFQINQTLGAFIDNYTNLVFGESLNPVGGYVNITVENSLYMATISEGIFQIVPAATGSQASTQIQPISNQIFDTLRTLVTFAPGRVELFNRKIYWACSTLNAPTVAVPSLLTNDVVLVYDLLFGQWMFFNNWDAVDIRSSNNNLYFLSKDDGALYLAFQDFEDARNSSVIGYTSEIWTKRFDFGKPSEVKTLMNPIYVEGYIDPSTKLTVKVLYNESGSLGQQNFIIDGSNPTYVQQIPQEYLGAPLLGFSGLGGENPVISQSTPALGVFRVYLDASESYGFYNIQLQFSTSAPGSNWNVGGIGFNLHQELAIPQELRISPSS